MKRKFIFSFLTALSFSLLTGCNSDNDNPSGGDQPVMKFTAEHDNTTRTSLSDAGAISWNNTDAVSINGLTSTSTVLSEGGAIATFTAAAATPTYYVFYPASMVSSFNETAHTYSITFPATQTYKNAVSFSDNTNPAVAVSGNTYLTFSNVCGMLKLLVNANITATKARFISNEAVSGVATVNPLDKTLIVTGSGKTIDITPLPLPTTEGYTLNWVLPARTYTAGWKIQLLDASDKVLAERVGTNALTIERSKITLASNSGGQSVSFKYGIPFNGLYWAKGNLYAPTTSSYNFAAAQEAYEYTSAGGYYFCYNTLNSQALVSTNTTATWNTTTDPCSKVLPLGAWRTPTKDELATLVSSSVWGTKNAVAGMYLGTTALPASGTEDNYVFLPAGGRRKDGEGVMDLAFISGGYYATSTAGSGFYYGLEMKSTGSALNTYGYRNRGDMYRCVADND